VCQINLKLPISLLYFPFDFGQPLLDFGNQPIIVPIFNILKHRHLLIQYESILLNFEIPGLG